MVGQYCFHSLATARSSVSCSPLNTYPNTYPKESTGNRCRLTYNQWLLLLSHILDHYQTLSARAHRSNHFVRGPLKQQDSGIEDNSSSTRTPCRHIDPLWVQYVQVEWYHSTTAQNVPWTYTNLDSCLDARHHIPSNCIKLQLFRRILEGAVRLSYLPALETTLLNLGCVPHLQGRILWQVALVELHGEQLRRWSHREAIPMTWVALPSDCAVSHVTLTAHWTMFQDLGYLSGCIQSVRLANIQHDSRNDGYAQLTFENSYLYLS